MTRQLLACTDAEHRVETVNGLAADLVAVTGDLVDGSVADLARHVAPIAHLSSRHGTFFVTGNHEYYSGAESWIAELRRLNVRVLLNEQERAYNTFYDSFFGAYRFNAPARSIRLGFEVQF